MSEYNAKNYTEQGGEVTHIGGKLVFEDGGSLEGGLMPNQAACTGTSNGEKAVNALLLKLKNAGLMVADAFTITVNHSVNDQNAGHANRTYNTGKISDVAYADGVITITLSDKVANLKDFDGGGSWGVHKWMGIGVSAGISPITGLYFNGDQLTDDDVTEATAMGLSAGYFVLWVKAERIVEGASNKFILWTDGYAKTEITLVLVEPDEE
ncbi:MAG: hypothetical protein IJK38_08360 [Oscillospiraceae bacterium]|nr:hypothetical protein [Oscillospiraceae bacterium]